MYSVCEQDTYIISLHQDGHGAHDGLQRKEQIGGFLGGPYNDPGYIICRLSDRVHSLNGSTIAGWGADGESDSSR